MPSSLSTTHHNSSLFLSATDRLLQLAQQLSEPICRVVNSERRTTGRLGGLFASLRFSATLEPAEPVERLAVLDFSIRWSRDKQRLGCSCRGLLLRDDATTARYVNLRRAAGRKRHARPPGLHEREQQPAARFGQSGLSDDGDDALAAHTSHRRRRASFGEWSIEVEFRGGYRLYVLPTGGYRRCASMMRYWFKFYCYE